jgi:hypothetical protein
VKERKREKRKRDRGKNRECKRHEVAAWGLLRFTKLTLNYLSLTSLSVNGFRGCRFMISLSASSYAREMAGT